MDKSCHNIQEAVWCAIPTINIFVDVSETKNDPAFMYENPRTSTTSTSRRENKKDFVVNRKTNVHHKTLKRCPIHKAQHSLLSCRQFLGKPLEERTYSANF